MRSHILAAVVLAAGLIFAAPALAEKGAPAAVPPPAAAPPAQDELSQTMSRIVGATSVYKALILESQTLMDLVLEGSDRAIDSDNPPTKAWLAEWKAKVRAQADKVRADRAALPPFPRELLKIFEGEPQTAAMVEGFVNLPRTAGGVADNMLALADDVTPLVEASVGGDEEAQLRLMKKATLGFTATLKTENALLDISINLGMPSHPQTALSRSIKASNEAMILVFDYLQILLDGGEADTGTLMQSVRAKLDESRAEARKVGPMARYMTQRMATMSAPAGFTARVVTAFATYEDSGRTELQIADVLEKGIVDLLNDPDAAESVLESDLAPLVDRRIQLQNQRVAALTQ